MTNNFQGGILSSHKPSRGVPYTHDNPLNQEKALSELEKFPPKNPNTFLLNDATISPEGTGIQNTPATRHQGLPYYKNSNFASNTNYLPSITKILTSSINILFYNYKLNNQLQQEEAEEAKSQFLPHF
jgi:hypothetical protein